MNPYEAPRSNVITNDVPPPYLKTWVIFFLLASVGGGLAGAVVGGLVGGVLGVSGVPLSTIGQTTGIVGFFAAMPVSYFSFRWAVGKYLVAPLRVNVNESSTDQQA